MWLGKKLVETSDSGNRLKSQVWRTVIKDSDKNYGNDEEDIFEVRDNLFIDEPDPSDIAQVVTFEAILLGPSSILGWSWRLLVPIISLQFCELRDQKRQRRWIAWSRRPKWVLYRKSGNLESYITSGVILRKSLSVQELSCGVFKINLNVKNIVLFYYCSKHMIYMSNIK